MIASASSIIIIFKSKWSVMLLIGALLLRASFVAPMLTSTEGPADPATQDRLLRRSHGTIRALRLRKGIQTDNLQQKYIIVYKDHVEDVRNKTSALLHAHANVKVRHRFSQGLKGAAVDKVDSKSLQAILEDEDVEYVEQDQMFKILAPMIDIQSKGQPRNLQALNVGVQQNPPSWGLDRIDQVSLPLDRRYRYSYSGLGVYIFILDTGISPFAKDLSGRTTCGAQFISQFPTDCMDWNGHGTFVSGTAAGESFGIAYGATIVSVQVMNAAGQGTTSSVIEGIDYVLKLKKKNKNTPMVVNISLGGPFSNATNNAVDKLVNAGVFVTVAAGNNNKDACRSSPGSAKKVVTVGATNILDQRAKYSNWGSCVDIMAPGTNITSDWFDGGIASASGTSMASPHVAGVAALYLEYNPSWTPAQVWNQMKLDASRGKLQNLNGSPNLLLSTYALNQRA